jgi:hypothetical protein
MEIYEEAVADFIDAAVGTYVQVYRYLKSKTPEERDRVRRSTQYLPNTWVRLFYDKYNGYYTKTINLAARTRDDFTTKSFTEDNARDMYKILDGEHVLGTFIESAGKAGLPTGYLREAVSAIKGAIFIDFPDETKDQEQTHVSPKADVVFIGVYLDLEEIEEISTVVLENKLPRNAKVTFAEERFNNK